jgi:nitroreductase
MPDLMEAIQSRRSIRNYQDKPIARDVLDEVLAAVRWSPSWANTQCWELVVVSDPLIKAALQETIAPKNPGTKAITGAPVVVALCAKLGTSGFYGGAATTKFGDWFLFDAGIAAQTLCLAAQGLGLGTVVIGLFDHERAKTLINLPAGHELVALIPMGYPAKVPAAPTRREPSHYVHFERF